MELSEIALHKLLQNFPEISTYIISFRDITEESGKEESGLKVGLFILQFGEEMFYIPVIAKNETVLPIDSLFHAETGTFCPLTRVYLDKIISSSQVYLGKRTTMPKTVDTNPSVYELVTPPRTGKFVYASSSRLVEFLAIMPNMVKKAMMEKFSEDKEVYNTLHKLFGLENLMVALKPTSPIQMVRKPAVEILTSGPGLSAEEIATVLDKGYVLRGTPATERLAVLGNDRDHLGPLKNISGADVIGADHDVVMRDGEVKSAFIPKRVRGAPQKATLLHGPAGKQDEVFMMFADGTYALSRDFVARGNESTNKKVIADYFAYNAPRTPREITNNTKVAIFSPDLDLIGAFDVWEVKESVDGVTMRGYPLGPHDGRTTIHAYRNCRTVDASNPEHIYVPINVLMAPLNKNVSDNLETNVNAALANLELTTLTTLGAAMDMGFDGVEFTINGKPMGSELKVIEVLVGQEGIAPPKAESFIKQAKELGKVKIYMSKKADFEPAEIPKFGEDPPQQEENFGVDGHFGAFKNNLRAAVDTQDAQMVESMIISELLQATDMSSLVKEYLPEIEAAIDKLGRTLFLARLNMDKLANSQNSNEIMSFIANLRNVYRLLGDNATKLERMVSGPEEAQEEAGIED